ncbi:pyrroline-5-carboxylate reductase [Clostridium hydrogenum]|uniref:pyrroline-5-carboxylate reductase n=1 Tax=Clostridium hydrogenum TaxID=2855764 RepID=UPI001F3FBAFE|nr:pyrroline-5-carboxylate reductase [Clostridium hydrogenum]
MNRRIGFIGCGNMAQAMIMGIVGSNIIAADNIMVSNPSEEKLNFIKDKCKVHITTDNKEVAVNSDILVLAVKPNKYSEVIDEIKDEITSKTIIVTIAAGISLDKIKLMFKKEVKVVRTMPNTPALVGEAMTALCYSEESVSEDEVKVVRKILESFGKTEVIDEKLMDAITGLSGSSPAYVYMFIEAMADGAVLQGMPREKAYKIAAQSVLGAAKMVLETGKHPGKLKDEVCSPGGTTIEAVYTLEKNNFRAAVMEAVDKCTEKSKEMSRK